MTAFYILGGLIALFAVLAARLIARRSAARRHPVQDGIGDLYPSYIITQEREFKDGDRL